MTRVIQHMRTFARQDTLRFIEVDVPSTINSALSLLGEQLRLHEIEVVLDFANDLQKITGEPFQLEQVWINLMSNAGMPWMKRKKRIKDGRLPAEEYRKKLTIKVEQDLENKIIKIRFSDNGIGISQEHTKKIFEPFFTTKEVGKGSGLGLSITYGIIESHKGKIEVESQIGQGVTFLVSLPIGVENDSGK